MKIDRSTVTLTVGGLVAAGVLIAGSYAVPTGAAPADPGTVVQRSR